MTQLTLDPSVEKAKTYQYFTPEWASVELIETYFPDLGSHDLVLEPSCGRGSFLKAIPAHVPAIGVEIDPEIAQFAQEMTGRQVICGDFLHVDLPEGITNIIGNPPFEVQTINRFLCRARHILPDLGRAGFLLPAYSMQTHNTVIQLMEHWSMRCDIVPRNVFPRLSLPLLFVLFTKGPARNFVGFALYRQAVEFDRLGKFAKEILTNGRKRKGVWFALVEEVLANLGGTAHLRDIYHVIEPRRPTPNAFWKEKVRQTLQRYFIPLGEGVWKYATN